MSKIAVIGITGESVFLSVDEFGATGETVKATSYHKELGGKGFNQAIAAALYGAEVSFLCACHYDDVKYFSASAKSKGIKSYFVGKGERSPYAVITIDKNGDNRVLVYRGAELEERDVDLFEEQIKDADILLINNEVPIEVNKKAIKIAKKNGVKVVLNPAPWRQHEKSFLDSIDLFTPNEHETFGLDDYQNVIVTLGGQGCLIRRSNEIIPAKKVDKVVDTTGAGDVFNGVLVACLAEGADIKNACKTANIAAAIKVGKKFIFNSVPTKNEIINKDKKGVRNG